MRPVLLELAGFCSYRTLTTVDFRDTDFFVLVGPTGSGKSTIVDAMVFALYGTVPRWNDARAVAPALAPTATRGVVRLIFDSGGQRYAVVRDVRRSGGKTASVTVKEARLERFTSSDALGASDDEVEALASGTAVSTEVERILGLNYMQFTQSVALPQGEFAKFLHSTDANRQEILKRLLDYNIYGLIQSAAHRRKEDAAAQATALEQHLAGLAGATDEDLSLHQAKLNQLQAFNECLTDDLVPRLRVLAATASDARAGLERLVTEQTALSTLSIPGNIAEIQAELQRTTESAKTAREQCNAAESAEDKIRMALPDSSVKGELEKIIERWEELQTLTDKQPELLRDAVQMTEKRSAANRALEDASAAESRARDDALARQQTAEKLTETTRSQRLLLDLVAEATIPAGVEAIAEEEANQRKALKEAQSERTIKTKAFDQAAEDLNALPSPVDLSDASNAAATLRDILDEDIAALEAISEDDRRLTRAQDIAGRARRDAEDAQKLLHELQIRYQAIALRASLRDGDQCPVCEQTVHIVPEGSEESDEFDRAENEVDAKRQEADNAEDAVAELATLRSQADALRLDRLKRAEQTRKALNSRLETVGYTNEIAALSSPIHASDSLEGHRLRIVALDSVASSLQQSHEQRAKAEAIYRSADTALRLAHSAVDTAEEASRAAQDQMRAGLQDIQITRENLAALKPPVVDQTQLADSCQRFASWIDQRTTELTDELTQLEEETRNAQSASEQAQSALQDAEASEKEANSKATAAALDEQNASNELKRTEQRLSELRVLLQNAKSGDQATTELAGIKELEYQLAELRKQVVGARAAVTDAETQRTAADTAVQESWRLLRKSRDGLAHLNAPEIEGSDLAAGWAALVKWSTKEVRARAESTEKQRVTSDAADRALGAAAEELSEELIRQQIEVEPNTPTSNLIEQALITTGRAVEKASATLTQVQQRREEAKGLSEQIKRQRERRDVAGMLDQQMRANNFPRWLVAGALDALLRDASRILMELSSGQFELTRSDSELLVIDHNDADMERIVKTLSGGETFQASLALALALSEQVTALSSTGANKLESIFLDEGFGTLDETTLDVVAGTLENLASSGSRMVGIITHVTALAERIPVRFRVSRDNTGSHIERLEAS